MRIGILGPEASGKSTLAKSLAEQFNAVYIPEYARTYLEQKGSDYAYTYDDVVSIARHQISELRTPPPCGTLSSFCERSEWSLSNGGQTTQRSNSTAGLYIYDTDLIITKVWFEHKYGTCPTWLDEAIKNFPMDYYILCAPDLEWVQDPTRENGSDAIRWELFDRYLSLIRQTSQPYYIHFHD